MNGGLKTALLMTGVALAGCSTANNGVKVRAIADPSATLLNGGDALAVARAQLMLGNVGLALEGFRKAERANPNDPAVISGIGDCYAAMGRFDIAESSYEVALSLAPRDHGLLMGLASVLERGGQTQRASDIRAEAERFQQTAALLAAQARSRALIAAKAADDAHQLASRTGSVTIELPPARPAKSVATIAGKPQVQSAMTAPNAALPASPAVAADRPAPTAMDAPLSAASTASVDALRVSMLPPAPVQAARPLAASAPAVAMPVLALDERLSSSVTVTLPPPAPVPLRKPPSPVALPVKVAEPAQPHLERLSQGEVALVTTGSTVWQPRRSIRTASADAGRWIPLAMSRAKPAVQVLNAARRDGLAASARSVLVGRGWRGIGIGNATALRRTSVVFYPRNRAALGRRLAAQFGVPAQMGMNDHVVLVLGRDSVGRIAGQRRS